MMWIPNTTWLFEVIHVNDPHIVHEKPGIVWLGCRKNVTGEFNPANDRVGSDRIADITLGEMLEYVNSVKHEGFMVYDAQGNCCKLKSPYYIGKKKLMRANKDAVESMYKNTFEYINRVDVFVSMWSDTIKKIIQTIDKDTWISYTDQERRAIIEEME